MWGQTAQDLLNRQPQPTDYLSFAEIEQQYPGTVKAGTLTVWKCKKRYNFHRLVTKIGLRCTVRRDRWESFLDSHTGATSPQESESL